MAQLQLNCCKQVEESNKLLLLLYFRLRRLVLYITINVWHVILQVRTLAVQSLGHLNSCTAVDRTFAGNSREGAP